MTHIHAHGPNIDSRQSVVSGTIPGGCCGECSFSCSTINAPDLIENDAHIHAASIYVSEVRFICGGNCEIGM